MHGPSNALCGTRSRTPLKCVKLNHERSREIDEVGFGVHRSSGNLEYESKSDRNMVASQTQCLQPDSKARDDSGALSLRVPSFRCTKQQSHGQVQGRAFVQEAV